MKKGLATALVLCSLFYSLQANAASSLAHATPIVNVTLCQIFMKEYSRPLIDPVRISVPEAKHLQNFFNQNFVVVDNHALNGRSSKSFVDEGHWAKVTKLIKKGDYVLIQFGHNDEKADEERHTDHGSTFDQYLSKYATETIALGGIPVLMSPVVRRNWKNGVLVDTHGDYRKSAKNVADKLKVNYIDANAITEKLESDLGEEGSKKLNLIHAS